MKTLSLAFALLFTGLANAEPLVVHEWGTFTCLQDLKGRTLGSVNSDDEPVPDFVHQISNVVRDQRSGQSKGVASFLSNVNLRLETPVIYFHLPKGQKTATVDVEVQFKGGWLTQYYPNATAVAPGLLDRKLPKGPEASTTGTLKWSKLKVGGSFSGPLTLDKVWTAPRSSKSDPVQTNQGEKEEFLFYRGLGQFQSPVTVKTAETQKEFTVEVAQAQVIRQAWLVEVDDHSQIKFSSKSALSGTTTLPMPAGPPKAENTVKLRGEMRRALIDDGLFPDEADAMLAAWQKSYFESQGRRLFYVVPHQWTDSQLPLKISCQPPPIVRRVMIGRVELITPSQVEALKKYRKGDQKARGQMGRFGDVLLIQTGL